MAEQKNLTSELRSVACESYPEVFARFRQLSERYGDMPAGAGTSADPDTPFSCETGGMP